MTSDEDFLREFEACRWPLERWHHRDHVKLAYLYLLRHGLAEAATRLREGIRAHNRAHRIPDLPLMGYHETMTQAWLRLVDTSVAEYGPSRDADSFCDEHPELLEKKALRLFYSRERFTSPEAKATFVAPDLAPLPVSRRGSGPAVDPPGGRR